MRIPGLLLFLALALPLSAFRLGPEVPLSPLTIEPAPFLRNTPRVASDGDDFLVVWNDIRGFSREVRGTRVRDDGTVLDPASIVIAGGNGQSLSVASNGRNYVVAYS